MKNDGSKKTFVLDTNVLIHDPDAFLNFADNDIVLPIKVIEELDRIKKGDGEIPFSARHALRKIESFRDKGENGSNLSKGVNLPGGGVLKIETGTGRNKRIKEQKNDNLIISAALRLKASMNGSGGNVVLVSKDTAVRIKADALDLITQDYLNDKTTVFQSHGNVIRGNGSTNGIKSVRYQEEGDNIFRWYEREKYEKIRRKKSVEGIESKNIEQECAIDALTNPRILSIALTGRAGSGKTLLAIAAGLHQVTKKNPLYDQLIVARPIVSIGKDLGALPGDLKEKLDPWMQPIYDNFDVIMGSQERQEGDKEAANNYKHCEYLIDKGILHIQALSHIRGRSLPRRYIVIDEAQNLRPVDIKTIVTRSGEGSKVVFTGDMEQIDDNYLDSASNGLAHLISRFINEPHFCYLNLQESVRSHLAERGAELL